MGSILRMSQYLWLVFKLGTPTPIVYHPMRHGCFHLCYFWNESCFFYARENYEQKIIQFKTFLLWLAWWWCQSPSYGWCEVYNHFFIIWLVCSYFFFSKFPHISLPLPISALGKPSKMLTGDIPPNQTIYIKNLNEKIKKEGTTIRLNLFYFSQILFGCGETDGK